MIDAATEGWMGYLIANALTNEFLRRGIRRSPVIVISRSIVSKNDPAFQNPTKYIGPIYDKGTLINYLGKRVGFSGGTPVVGSGGSCHHQSRWVSWSLT